MKRLQLILSVLGLFFITIMLSYCGGSKTEDSSYSLTQNPPFKIEEVYSQKWIAGIKGGGSGTNIYFKIEDIESETTINEIYFRNKTTKAKAKNSSQKLFIGSFKNNENMNVIMDSDSTKEAVNIPPEKFPFHLEANEAVLSYIYKGKFYYFKVTNVFKKEVLPYPQSNLKIEN